MSSMYGDRASEVIAEDRRLGNEAIPPVLRWVGGKSQMVVRLLRFLPDDVHHRQYWEPFFGAGSLFFALQPAQASISDANGHLMSFYNQLRSNPDLVHRKLVALSQDKSPEHYYSVRDEYNRSRSSGKRAAMFLYLNKHCFNGIFRVNRKGKFNTPFGKRRNYVLPTREHLRSAAAALGRADLATASFEDVLSDISARSFVYLDPPYPPLNGTSFFTHYTADRFSRADQERLADTARELSRGGALFMMTNADTPETRRLYSGFNQYTLSAVRYVTCKRKKHQVSELVVTNYDLPVSEVLL